ncbi:hypothetical protein ES702_07028 [subsurface metagenome]
METELKMAELGTEEFTKFFNVHLGEMPSDPPEDSSTLEAAIAKMWATECELSFEEQLYLTPLISKELTALVVLKEDLMPEHRGDTLYVNRLAPLEPANDGDLGTQHRVYGNESPLDDSRIAITPSRRGVGVAWVPKVQHSISYDLRQEVKGLISNWAAGKVERMLISSANSAPQTIFSGVATSLADLTSSDVLMGRDLSRAFAVLKSHAARGIGKLGGYFFACLSPECFEDLKEDAAFLAAVTATSSQGRLEITNYLESYAGLRLFSSTYAPTGITEGSPGVAYQVTLVMAARALALAWESRWSWKERNEHYGEIQGIMSDAWLESAVLNPNYIVKIISAYTPLEVTTTVT